MTVHWGDAMALELASLSPAPDKVVANLPYGIAATRPAATIEELPAVALWVAMTQKEVGERLAATRRVAARTARRRCSHSSTAR